LDEHEGFGAPTGGWYVPMHPQTSAQARASPEVENRMDVIAGDTSSKILAARKRMVAPRAAEKMGSLLSMRKSAVDAEWCSWPKLILV
jgi:hypothetical protein